MPKRRNRPRSRRRNYILIDLSSQQVLAEREADAQSDPASLTKLMTAYLVFDAIRDKKLTLTQTLPVSTRAWAERKGGGSLMFIDTDDDTDGRGTAQGHDRAERQRCIGRARRSGRRFARRVRRDDEQAGPGWGLKNTQFKNVTGLSEAGHYASARDVALVAAKIINDFPDFYTYYSIRQYTYNKIKQDNRNLLLGRDPTVDGMKTGYTDAAGYCLVASAVRDMPNGKRRLLSVVLGTASREARASESQKLLNWGFQAWDAVRLFEADKAVLTRAGVEGHGARSASSARRAPVVVSVPQRRRRQAEDADRAHRPADGAADRRARRSAASRSAPLPAPTVAERAAGGAGAGAAGRHLLGRTWDAIRACGSSKLDRPGARERSHASRAARYPVLSERRVHARVRRQGVVLDRGFIFGDGIYEVVPVYARRLFRFDEHMARLERGLGKVRIANPHGREQWLQRSRELVRRLAEGTGAADQLVYIQLTRGVAPRDHVMPPEPDADRVHDGQRR